MWRRLLGALEALPARSDREATAAQWFPKPLAALCRPGVSSAELRWCSSQQENLGRRESPCPLAAPDGSASWLPQSDDKSVPKSGMRQAAKSPVVLKHQRLGECFPPFSPRNGPLRKANRILSTEQARGLGYDKRVQDRCVQPGWPVVRGPVLAFSRRPSRLATDQNDMAAPGSGSDTQSKFVLPGGNLDTVRASFAFFPQMEGGWRTASTTRNRPPSWGLGDGSTTHPSHAPGISVMAPVCLYSPTGAKIVPTAIGTDRELGSGMIQSGPRSSRTNLSHHEGREGEIRGLCPCPSLMANGALVNGGLTLDQYDASLKCRQRAHEYVGCFRQPADQIPCACPL